MMQKLLNQINIKEQKLAQEERKQLRLIAEYELLIEKSQKKLEREHVHLRG